LGKGWNGIEHEISYNASIIGNVISILIERFLLRYWPA
jgi:hypothetical protein